MQCSTRDTPVLVALFEQEKRVGAFRTGIVTSPAEVRGLV